MKKNINIPSFEEIEIQKENLEQISQNLALSLERKNLKGIDAALAIFINPTMVINGRLVLTQLFELPDNHQRFLEQLNLIPSTLISVEKHNENEDQVVSLKFADSLAWLTANGHESNQIDFKASDFTDPSSFESLHSLLKNLLQWTSHEPFLNSNKELNYLKIRDANKKFLMACKNGDPRLLEMALSEGACILSVDEDGTPGLTNLMHHSDHANLMATVAVVDPTLALYSENSNFFLRTTPGGRRKAGNAAEFIYNPKTLEELPLGYKVQVSQEHISDRLFVHLKNLQSLNDSIKSLENTFYMHSSLEYGFRMPNMVEFKKLLNDQFEPTLQRLKK